jgi:hypothetical protein
MTDSGRYFDDDPRPRRSPRLYAGLEDVPGAAPTSAIRLGKPSPERQAALARDMMIYFAIEGGMSQRMVARALGLSQPGILKAYRRITRRKSRV